MQSKAENSSPRRLHDTQHFTTAMLTPTLLCILLFCFHTPINGAGTADSLLACLRHHRILNYTAPTSSSFDAVWEFSLQNLRFTEAGVPRPSAIVLPASATEVQHAWQCIRAAQWAVRVRNGGHSYEGLSSTASPPFAIIDLMNMHSVTVNVARKFAWADAGVRLGELYYAVASESNNTLGFSAGTCSTIGLSGHIMGGGFGALSRKYGVSADNVLDAQVITSNGTLIKKVSTVDPDLFWALRAGGGGAWGIVVAWKLRLVSVPGTISTFNVSRTGRKALRDLVFKWQSVASAAPSEVFFSVSMTGISSLGGADISATFYGQYWGTINQTLAFFSLKFPELGLSASDCQQGNWIQAVAVIAGLPAPEGLLNRQQSTKYYFKAKSDYASEPLTKRALSGAFDRMMNNTGNGLMIFEPYGGVMSKISSNAIAFPHRAGNLFMIQYLAFWLNDTNSPDREMISWLRGLYGYMGPFVTYTPSRSAYVNYIDLDLGDSVTAGRSYFGSNFAKLVKIKARFDPSDIFNEPQSVPTSM